MDVGSILEDAARDTAYSEEEVVRVAKMDALRSAANEAAFEDEDRISEAFRGAAENYADDFHDSPQETSAFTNNNIPKEEERKKSYDEDENRDDVVNVTSREKKDGSTRHTSPGGHDDSEDEQEYTDNFNDEPPDDRKNTADESDEEDDGGGDEELNTELLVAAYRGDIRKVDKLIRSGASCLARDRHRWTAIMWAAAGGYDDIIESIIGTLRKSQVKGLLNAKDSITGWTALHVSSCPLTMIVTLINGRISLTLILLLNLITDLNIFEQIACTKGRRRCVEILLKHGADRNAKSFLSDTPLDCLNTTSADDRKIMRALLEGNTNIRSISKNESKRNS